MTGAAMSRHRLWFSALGLVTIANGCASNPSVTPRVDIVYVTPVPTATSDPTPVPTPDLAPDWFDAACDSAKSIDDAVDSFVGATDSTDTGDPEAVFEWIETSRGYADDARASIASMPDWDPGADYRSGAESLLTNLDRGLDSLESDPVSGITYDEFLGVIQGRFDLVSTADRLTSASRRIGCSLGDAVW
jgi:hypothetical protein